MGTLNLELENNRIMKNFVCLLAFAAFAACTSKSPEMVTISGRVTDFDGNPIDSVTVSWLNPGFSGQYYATTDADGRYCARIPKGRYAYAGGINMTEYPNAGSTLPEAEQRLENWHWNYIADRDTTFDFRYHRLEVYGVNAFQVQGAMPGYTVYFRPMSLTRSLQTKRKFPNWEQDADFRGSVALAPPIDSARIEVTINGEPVAIRLAQEVKEYFGQGVWSGAYLLFVDRPKENRPVKTFRIVMEDLGNGDKGEATYTLEEKTSDDYIWPEGEIDATHKK